MVQPSRIFQLWTRLYRRFLIEPYPVGDAGPSVSTTIQPTTDADELLRNPTGISANGDLTGSAGGAVTYYIVPAGERWTLRHLYRELTTANSQIYLFTGGFTIFLTAPATAAGRQDGLNIRLSAADQIGMIASGDAGDGAIFLQVVYEIEDAWV